jgi:alanine dehydrogenase
VTRGPEASVLVLSQVEVERLLDLDRLVDAVAVAMAEMSAGRVSIPPRVAAEVSDRRGLLVVMPAFLPSARALTVKLVSLFPDNRDRPTHQALICCFDPDSGTPLAVMDGSFITATRTAAGSALATRLLARVDARVVSIIGTGVQARSHARLLARRSGVQALQIAGRNLEKVQALVAELAGSGVPVTAVPSIEEAARSADIICVTTHADEPVVRREWLRPGSHVNSVGYNTAGTGEIDIATIRDALVVVESRAAALAAPPAGAIELRRALEAGAIDEGHVHELGELISGTRPGRRDEAQLTLYKSVGVAVQDACAAALVLEAVRTGGGGTSVPI